MNSEKILDISWGTIWKFFLVAVLLYIFYQIKDILIWFVFAVIISILFNPAINFLRKFKIPRNVAVFLVYGSFLGILILFFYITLPLFIEEIKNLSFYLPQYFDKISPFFKKIGFKEFPDNINTFIDLIIGTLDNIAANVSDFLFALFGGIFSAIFILTLAIYISFEGGIEKMLILFFPKKYESYFLSLWQRCQKKIDSWFLVRILSCFFVGFLSFIIFFILNVSYSFLLGLAAGVLNFIPIVGPIIFGFLLFIIVATENLTKALFVLIIFILIQQLENNILTPMLSKRIIGLPSSLVLLSLTIGGVLFGFLGAILAVPLIGIIYEFLIEYLEKRRSQKTVVL